MPHANQHAHLHLKINPSADKLARPIDTGAVISIIEETDQLNCERK